jgi:hypothetical protein
MTRPWKCCEAEGNCMKALSGRDCWIAGLSLASGAALGAFTMYLCDPNRGRARRAKIRQTAFGAASWSRRTFGCNSEDLLDRAKDAISSGIAEAKELQDRLARKMTA